MFKINGKNHKVIGTKNDRVIFQLFEKNWHCGDISFPSFKINFCRQGYFVNLPQEGYLNYKKVYMNEILKEISMLQEIIEYYKEDKN